MRRFALLLLLCPAPALAQAAVSDADARAFVAAQEAAWNAGRLERYFSSFSPEATFTDQAYVGDKPPAPYGTSTVAEARALARRAFARKPWPSESGRVLRVEAVPGASQVRVVSVVGSTVWSQGKPRRLCATRVQTLATVSGRVRALSQTDTFVKCRGG